MTSPVSALAPAKSVKLRQFLTFLLTGGVSALATVLVRVLLSNAMSFEAAVAVSYLFGMSFAYILSRRFVFRSTSTRIGASYVKFALVNVMSFAIVWVVSVGLADWLFPTIGLTSNAELIAHVIGVASPAIPSYYAHSAFTFRSTR